MLKTRTKEIDKT